MMKVMSSGPLFSGGNKEKTCETVHSAYSVK